MAVVMPEMESARACPACETVLPAAALFCSRCGLRLDGSKPAATSAESKWYYNVWFVLFMLFLILGPFGLPLVWKNPRFSRLTKLVLTLTMALYTVLLVDVTMKAIRSAIDQVNQIKTLYP
jgi:hypothetical protein